ncbi:MAG: helix-turn-helix domain-containing protein, partial [Halorientalis sp.]
SWSTRRFNSADYVAREVPAVAATPAVRIETTHYINPVGDGQYVELSRFTGDMDALADLLAAEPTVLEYELPADDDGLVYARYESTPLFDGLVSVITEHAIVLQWPVEFVTDHESRGVRLTFMGSETALGGALDAVPSGIDVSLVRTGEYTGATGDPLEVLSDEQRALLETAIEAGYYEVPRGTTQADLADRVGVSHATISDRLRRIETTLVTSLVPRL